MNTGMGHRLLLFILTFIIISATQSAAPLAAPQAADNAPVVARVTLRDAKDVERFVQLGLDVLEMRQGDDLFILTSTAQVEELRAKGWAVRVDRQQTDLFNQQQATHTYSGGYRTVAEMRAYVDSKVAQYPNLAEVFVYGQSWEKVHSGGSAGSDLFG